MRFIQGWRCCVERDEGRERRGEDGVPIANREPSARAEGSKAKHRQEATTAFVFSPFSPCTVKSTRSPLNNHHIRQS